MKKLRRNISRRAGAAAVLLRRKFPVPVLIGLLSIVLGIGVGAVIELFKWALNWLMKYATTSGSFTQISFRMIVFPLVGIILAGLFQRYVIREDIEGGTARLKGMLADKKNRCSIGFGNVFNPLIGCWLTVGFGSSAGAEGPAAYSGAAFGSSLSRWCRLPLHWERLLMGIGAAAGISAIFKAPVGGALYTLELLGLPMTTLSVTSLLLATVTSAATSYMISGFAFDMTIISSMKFDMQMLGWVSLTGLLVGFYSLWYVWSMNRVAAYFRSRNSVWLKTLLSGVVMSGALFVIPALYGEGWNILNEIANGRFPTQFRFGIFGATEADGFDFYVLLGVILLIKGALVAAANYGGGIAGDMVPALFTGGIAAYLFINVLNAVFGLSLPVWYLSLAGMGALLANSSGAPLMSAFIVYECTNTAQYLPGYLLCTLVSYSVMKLVQKRSL